MDFNNSKHLERFKELTPGYLGADPEWLPVAFIISSDDELWKKCRKHINVGRREIDWMKIFKTDFGSGHRAALQWAYAMWAGRSWGGLIDERGNEIEKIDTVAYTNNMGERLAKTVYQALGLKLGIIKYRSTDKQIVVERLGEKENIKLER